MENKEEKKEVKQQVKQDLNISNPGPIGEQGQMGIDGKNETITTSTGNQEAIVATIEEKISNRLQNVIDAIKVKNSTGNMDEVVKHLEVALTFYKKVAAEE